MNIIKKLALTGIPLSVFLVLAIPAHAYYYGYNNYNNYNAWQPNYVQGFSQPAVYAQAPNPPSYGFGYQQDFIRPLIQGQLNFVSQFTYIPGPVHPYFYTYYQPYGYGW